MQFSILFGQPIVIYFSNKNPSAKYESLIEPPAFLIILMYSKLELPYNLRTASTANLAKFSFFIFEQN